MNSIVKLFKISLSPAVIFWHDDHAWTNTHNGTMQKTGFKPKAFSTKTIVQTTLLTIQIGLFHSPNKYRNK